MADADSRPARRRRPLHRWVRFGLVILVVGWALVFFTAASLDPYDVDGSARTMETHRQLGLPPCSFKVLTGLPCPSCGMTTSFALLVRADVWHSVQANFAGTALAAFGLAFIPWALGSALLGRVLWVRSVELTLLRLSIVFMILMFGRWAVALALAYYAQQP